MNTKKYKFAFIYNNVIKYLEFDSGTEIGMLKWNLISHLPKGIKQSNPVFTYKGKPFADNEYNTIDSVFKEEMNEIKCELVSNACAQGNTLSQKQPPSEKNASTSKSDIIINSQSIINSLTGIEASPYFKFFTTYQKELISPIELSFSQMKKEIDKTLEDFMLKAKQSLIEYINIKQFENIQDGIMNIKSNLGRILKDSNTIENLFNVYEDSTIEYKKITAMTKNLSQRFNDLLVIHYSINESISHLIQITKSFTQCYDYKTFIPYGNANGSGNGNGRGNIQDMLCKGFSFESFINKASNSNSKLSSLSSDKDLISGLMTAKKPKGITEQDLKYAEQLNINTFIEKVEEITFLRVERVSKIKKRFESITEEIKKVQDKLIAHFNRPEDEQTYLASVTQKIKEVNSLISSKMTFEDRKQKEASLSESISEIRQLDKKIKRKYDEILFDNKIIEMILNTSTRDFMAHINTKYDCITDIEKIKKIFDYNSLIIASNSKIELWKTFIDFRNENVSEINDSSKTITTTSNIQDIPLNGVNEQMMEVLNILPNKIDELNQTIAGYNKLTEALKKVTNDNKALLCIMQNSALSVNAILNNTNCIKGVISSFICTSSILTKQSEVEWISSQFPKETKYKLVYQASSDGCLSADFHRKCDGINDNLVVIETVNGFKFGGFTSKSWDINTKRKGEDMKAFIMSITSLKRYEIENKKNAVYSSNDHLCCFGDEIAILNNCLNRNDNYNMAPEKYLCEDEDPISVPSNNYLAGEKLFRVKELEVFHVITQDNNDYDLTASSKM